MLNNNDIPALIYKWNKKPGDGTYEVTLFNGQFFTLCIDSVRDFSIKNRKRWNEDAEYEAIKYFIEKNIGIFINENTYSPS